jgi:hypothetical protein
MHSHTRAITQLRAVPRPQGATSPRLRIAHSLARLGGAVLALAVSGGATALAQVTGTAPPTRAAIVPAPSSAPVVASPAVYAPTLDAARAGVEARFDVTTAPQLDAALAAALSQGQKVLIFGGAIILAGAIIGGDAGTVVVIGGAGVALYGLYLMLFEEGRHSGSSPGT